MNKFQNTSDLLPEQNSSVNASVSRQEIAFTTLQELEYLAKLVALHI